MLEGLRATWLDRPELRTEFFTAKERLAVVAREVEIILVLNAECRFDQVQAKREDRICSR